MADILADSPWAGEAELHLGCKAQFSGSWAEAQFSFEWILGHHKPGDAIYHLTAALHSMRATGSLTGQAEVMGYFGELADRAGDAALARERYDQAARLLVESGAPGGWLWQRISALSPLARRALGTPPGGPAPYSDGAPRRAGHQHGQPIPAEGGEP